MRVLIIAVTLAAASAHAEGIAWLENLDGGKIVLQNDTCYSPATGKYYDKLYSLYTYSAAGNSARGCWVVEDNMVHVVWDGDGTESRFSLDRFHMISQPKSAGYSSK